MKKVLITGSAGFVGGAFQKRLNNSGWKVLGLDNFSTYYSPEMKRMRIDTLEIANQTIDLDITNKLSIEKIFTEFQPTHVVHLAAQGGVRASRNNPKPYLETNQLGFLNMLECSEKFNVEKFVFASSSSVYGDNLDSPFEENAVLSAPKSLYALSKFSNELISKYLPQKNTQRIGLRFFTVYGPWGRPDMAMYRLLASSKLGVPFKLTAKSNTKRDFTFVEDVALVIEEIIRKEENFSLPSVLNVAGGNPYSLDELFSILTELGISIDSNQEKSDPLDVAKTHGSTKLLSELGFSVPTTTLKTGIERTWEWINSQKESDLRAWFEYQQ